MKCILSLSLVVMTVSATVARADTAIFAGGCFWCVEALYQEAEGVSNAVSGFTGGTHPSPTYSGSHDGHFEAVLVTYDPKQVSYQQLLDLFWVNVDPLDNSGQFCDKGFSYRSAIFVANDEERELAVASKKKVEVEFAGQEVFTEILAATKFFPVEEYHQDYYTKNPIRYRLYRSGCRRDARLKQIWGERTTH